jgi:hypothetical protein
VPETPNLIVQKSKDIEAKAIASEIVTDEGCLKPDEKREKCKSIRQKNQAGNLCFQSTRKRLLPNSGNITGCSAGK